VRPYFILPVLLLCSCSRGESEAARTAYVSVPPLAAVVQRIGGEAWTVGAVVKSGQDPHTLALTPAESMALAGADVFFSTGTEIEKHILERVRLSKIVRVDLDDEDEAAETDHEHRDPHVWLDPDALTEFAKAVAAELSREDPDHAGDYDKRYRCFAAQVSAAAQQARTALAPFAGRRFYVQHPAFGHFGEAFGLEQMPLEQEGREATPKELLRLAAKARSDGVRVIWVQPGHNPAPARELANALGAELRELDPLPADPVTGIVQTARLLAEGFALEATK
jgi:zinc transport system substrate-binding protein